MKYISANANYFSNREFLDKKLLGLKNYTDEEVSSKMQIENVNEGNNYMSNFSMKNDIENIKFDYFENNDDINMFSTKFGELNTADKNENKSENTEEEEKPIDNYKEDEKHAEANFRIPEESKNGGNGGNQIDHIPIDQCNRFYD